MHTVAQFVRVRWALCLLIIWCGVAAAMVTSVLAQNASPSSPRSSFIVTAVDLSVSPGSISDLKCGTSATFTYTTIFHIGGNKGGLLQFSYTVTNGRGSTSASVLTSPGQQWALYTFTSSGALPPDHTFPGIAIVKVTQPNSIQSAQVVPAGVCS